MKVAIRDDDTAFFTKPEDLKKAYDFLKPGDCISLSIVPFTVPVHKDCVFPYGKDLEYRYYDIADNPELLDYLRTEKTRGTYDFLLHGYSHEYRCEDGKWVTEMLWKTKAQLSEELQKGKEHLEQLLDCNISVLVAPNNGIDQKAISVAEELGMHYSGIIGFHDRKFSVRYIINFMKRWYFRFTKKIQYPGVLNYGKHKELCAYTLDSYERLVKEYTICKQRNVPFVVYTHYWQLNENPRAKQTLMKLYDYVIRDGAQIVPLSECF